jgi:glutamyl-tRNA synthetase
METRRVRVRFAPSPTGPLHIGGVRTALFNYLFAKKHGGDFLLRIEDTDQTRYVEGAEEYIIESLKWCGIRIDEGVTIGGPHQPYRQSERRDIYKKYALKLVEAGNAYYAFDSPEELEKMRKKFEAEKKDSQYGPQSRMMMKNGLTLSPEEVEKRLSSGDPYVIRFKIPENEDIKIFDLIRHEVVVHSSTLDDKVLFKSDGLPTYHLANVVDDHLMEISHVIRGEEWLPSTPLHFLLYRSFGWEKDMPQFAHLPLLLKPDGKGKLSKRDGDRLGFPVFPLLWTDPKSGEISSGYRESGYFPEAFINMLALLGWNPGTEQEIFTMDELSAAFSLEKVGKSGSKFDSEKAKWFNQHYLRMHSDVELAALFKPLLKEKGIEAADEYVASVCSLLKERVTFVREYWDQGYYFFVSPDSYDEKAIKKFWKPDTKSMIKEFSVALADLADFSDEGIHNLVKTYIENKGIGMGQVMNPLRLCMVGTGIGPDMITMMLLLGKQEVLNRIQSALSKLE